MRRLCKTCLESDPEHQCLHNVAHRCTGRNERDVCNIFFPSLKNDSPREMDNAELKA